MRRARRANLTAIALFANAIMLGLILIVLLSRNDSPRWMNAAFAQTPGSSASTPQPIAGGAGLFLMPAQFFTNMWGCYVMDVDAQTLCAYQYYPVEKQLRLVAARSFRYDRQLGNFNTEMPSPAEVKALVEKEKAGDRVNNAETPAPTSPEAPK